MEAPTFECSMLTRPIKKYAINLAPPSNEKDTSIAYGVWVSNSRPTGETEKIVIGASLLTQQHPFYMLLADAMKKATHATGRYLTQ